MVGYRDVPGKPALYGTTRQFLDYFNLKSLDQMPPLSELRDLDELEPELELGDLDAGPMREAPPPEQPPHDEQGAREAGA